jgi:hypothetical protein
MSQHPCRRRHAIAPAVLSVLAGLLAAGPASAATAPDTTASGPWVSRTTSLTYRAAAGDPADTLQCSLNSAAWRACASPVAVTGVTGANNLRVRAVAADGTVDPSPASLWTMVDVAPPKVAVARLADGATLTAPAQVKVSGADDYLLSRLDVWVDGTAVAGTSVGYSAASGSATVALDPAKLVAGSHQLRARATDQAGNVGESLITFVKPADRLFAAAGPWNAKLPAATPIDAGAPAIMSAFQAEISREIGAGVGPWINTTQYSSPLYTAGAAQARVPVIMDGVSAASTLASQMAAGVPIPAGATAARGSDANLDVWQPATDTLWDFWGAYKAGDGWHARWGGVMHDVSTSPGFFRDRTDAAGKLLESSSWGSSAIGVPAIAGVITLRDARQGVIDHALALAVPRACATRRVAPAVRSDGTSTAQDCLPEGARLRLDPSFDVNALTQPFARMIAKAAQDYGIVVRDQTASVTTFFAEDPTQYGSDLWVGTNGANGLLGAYPWDLVQKTFPWGRLQLLPTA